MIIRKPFAFIVNHFKAIHFALLIPLMYLGYKLYRLMIFFRNFVSAGFVTSETDIVARYYSLLIPISAIIIAIVSILILALFKQKNKNYIPYLILSVFYILIFIVSFFLPQLLYNYEITDMAGSTSRIISGISNGLFIAQPVAFLLIVLLGFGLDFTSGEFQNIMDEISLDEEDSEQVEINISADNYKAKRFVRKRFRELKYYVVENKNIFKVIGMILGGIAAIFLVMFIISLNRIVRVDQSFSHSSFAISFNDSLLSSLDYNGNRIMNGKIYLAFKVSVKNNSRDLKSLDTGAFWLEIDGNYYYPVLDRSGKFIDLARPYYGEKIGSGDQKEYVVVYELDESLVRKNYKIRILDSITYKENDIIPKYKEITLTPEYSNVVRDEGTYQIGQIVSFSGSTLKNSNITVNSSIITKNYVYEYEFCYNEKCSQSKNSVSPSLNNYLIVLDASLNLDENASYTKNKLGSNNFYQDFTRIEYKIGDSESYTIPVKDITPSVVKDKTVLEVNSIVNDATSMNLQITIRNKRYNIVLK